MTLAPLLHASLAIQIHTAAALGAFGLGIVQLAGVKGTRLHRGLGWVWVAAMAVTAGSSFWITTLNDGAFGPIHILSGITLAWLPLAVLAAHRGAVPWHARIMQGLFFGAIIVAGAFTLWPGRLLHTALFGG